MDYRNDEQDRVPQPEEGGTLPNNKEDWDRTGEELVPELQEEVPSPEMGDMEEEIRKFVYRQGILNGALEVNPNSLPSAETSVPLGGAVSNNPYESRDAREMMDAAEVRRMIADVTNARLSAYIHSEKKRNSFRRMFWIASILLVALVGFLSGYTLYMMRWDYVKQIQRGLDAFSQKYESEIAAQKLSMDAGTIKDVYKATLPSVVAVNVKTYGLYEGFSNGTGFFVAESDDYFDVVTNYHVIENFTTIELEYLGQYNLGSAEIVGSDAVRDIALLRIRKADIDPEILTMIKVIPVADSSKVEVGEQVMALGNPLGYSNTATLGIVSAVDRRVDSELLAKYIQTDAAINPGNSGGPLVNMKGELIGVNTVKVGVRSRIEGIGFAIPSNTVMKLVEQISDKGFADRPLLGISGREYASFDLEGVMIVDVKEDTPAERAGLLAGDIITAIGGYAVRNVMGLNTYLAESDLGSVIKLSYIRGGKEFTVDVKLDTARGRD